MMHVEQNITLLCTAYNRVFVSRQKNFSKQHVDTAMINGT